MFNLERGLRYWLYSEPTDMRKSFHTLSGLVRNKIGGDPMNGDVYIFVNKRRNRIKLLHYETGGMVIYAKMLDRGTFGLPSPPRLSRYVNDGRFCIDNNLVENPSDRWPWAGRTSCSVETTMLQYVLPSSTPWWTVARPWA